MTKRRDGASGTFEEVIGVKRLFAPDDLAPPVDRGLIERLLHKELPDPTAREVVHFIAAFRLWNEAFAEAVAKQRGG